MALQFIIGGSGSGKSTYAYNQLIEEARREPERQFYCIVPEQFTMSTQQKLVSLSPDGGILNIDVLSFQRLAYRIFEETGGEPEEILEDSGKSMVLEKLLEERKAELSYLGSQIHKPGCIDETKSLISEFMQYEIRHDNLQKILEGADPDSLLAMKLRDLSVIYDSFREYLGRHSVTNEELLEVLLQVLPRSGRLKGSTMVFDGFTGFTPVQISVLKELFTLCRAVRVTLTMDPEEPLRGSGKLHQLFYMSHEMAESLYREADKVEPPVFLKSGRRFSSAPALAFMEKNLFRYSHHVFSSSQNEIRVYFADDPVREMEEAARRIRRLVRTEELRYGEIAVITGNLEDYGTIAKNIFSKARIPCFIDEKRNVLGNPFVEWIRAALEIVTRNYSYESIFRYLRSGFSSVPTDAADRMENYVRGTGVRGKKKWSEKWIRTCKTVDPEEIPELDHYREELLKELSVLSAAFGSGKREVSAYCRSLTDFLLACDARGKLMEECGRFREKGLKDLEKEYSQIFDQVTDLLEKMDAIMGEERISRLSFCQLLETGLSQLEIGLIPPGVDQVLVGDMERSRLGEIKALFFVGVNEGSIPKNPETGGFLTQIDREYFASAGIRLAPGPRERIAIGKFYLYLNLTKPSRFLTLSYSSSDAGGQTLRPAALIKTLTRMFPQMEVSPVSEGLDAVELPGDSFSVLEKGLLAGEDSLSDPLFMELYSWYLRSGGYAGTARRLVDASFCSRPSDVIGKNTAKILYGEISPYAATRLERYGECAFRHFLTYGLRLCERAEYEFRAMDLGNVMHSALERFSVLLRKEGKSWAQLDPKERDRLADLCVEEAAADYGNAILHSTARDEYMIRRTQRILKKTVWVLQEQLRNGDFEPESFELPVEGGKIDRLDISREGDKVYVKVIDYKSGRTDFSLEKIYHGIQLQLVLYMDAALAAEKEKHQGCEVIPAGMFYYHIEDPVLQPLSEDARLEDAVVSRLKMDGLVHADQDVSSRIDRTGRTLPVTFNQDGSLSRRSMSYVAGREQFASLIRHVRQKMEDSLEKIMEGHCEASPYRLGSENACEYCPMKGACGFDLRIPGYRFRTLRKMDAEEVWRRIEAGEDPEEGAADPSEQDNEEGGRRDAGSLDG